MRPLSSYLYVCSLVATLPAQSPLDELRDMRQPSVEQLRLALGAKSEPVGQLAAQILVHEVSHLPEEILRSIAADERARDRLFAALAKRPRRRIGEWFSGALPTLDLSPAERLQALAALVPAKLSRAESHEVLDGAASQDSWMRSLAFSVADRMSAKQADLLVADVHKRYLDGVSWEQLLPCLSRMSDLGERHLISIARTLPADPRTEIAEWLAVRSSHGLQDFIRDGLRGDAPMPPTLLRLLDGPIASPGDMQRLLALLEVPSAPLRRAAFHILTVTGEYHHALLNFALAEPGAKAQRVRSLLTMDLPTDALLALLDDQDPEVVLLGLQHLGAEGLHGAFEAKAQAFAEQADRVGDAAARLILSRGRPATVQRLWELLPEDRRRSLSSGLRSREGWALALVRELPIGAEDWGLRQTRIVLGDAEGLHTLLADYSTWPLAWLRRMESTVTASLTAEHLPILEALLAAETGLDSDHRAYLSAYLAARPDLGGAATLRRLYREDPDEEVRSEALDGLLRRPEERAILYAELHAEIGRESMVDFEELAYRAAGSLSAPMSAAEAKLLARLLLVAPLGGVPEPEQNLGMVNIAGRILRSGASEVVVAAFTAAAAEALTAMTPSGYDDRYITALLTALCFDERVRVEIGPLIARLILADKEVSPSSLGPAWLVAAQGAAAEQRWLAAAEACDRAAPLLLRHPLPPLQRRAFLGDNLPGTHLGLGSVYAHRDIYQLRASLAAGDLPAARRAEESATIYAYGDQQVEAELRALSLEFPR